ncbi:hypothetical protein Tco_1055477 [Tanacetum coccineum]|uniref:Uncharacterized protein n=1 Tax=Tanacetum coccineum TaxID=301880 RepID=A0ABQ5H180_9ASTR
MSDDDVVDLTGDEDPTDEDGDIGVLVSLGDEIYSKGKKSRESSIGDSDNTGDGGKIAGKITVVTLVGEQMSPWKRFINYKRLKSEAMNSPYQGNPIDGKSISKRIGVLYSNKMISYMNKGIQLSMKASSFDTYPG